ncbi:MAG: hypothetical protein Kow0059_07170 [Candidatus Sumerlaeia bacterium]
MTTGTLKTGKLTPSSFRPLLPGVFIFLLAFSVTGPALRFPWSLVDDAWFLRRAEVFWGALFAFEPKPALQMLFTLDQTEGVRSYGMSVNLLAIVMRALLGQNIFLWHVGKSLTFFAFLTGLFYIGRLAGFSVGACLFGVILNALFNPWWLYQDFQTYTANWVRINTTDSVHIIFTVWQTVFFLVCLKRPEPARGPLLGLFLSGLLAYLCKVNVLYSIGAFGGILLLDCLLRKSVTRRDVAVAAALLVPWFAGLLYFAPWAKGRVSGYAKEATTSWVEYRTTMLFFRDCILDSLGLIFPVGVAAVVVFLARRGAGRFEKLAVGLVGLLFVGGFLVQSAWPYRIPRYMLSFLPHGLLLIGACVFPILSKTPLSILSSSRKNLALSYVLGAGVWAAGLVPLVVSQAPRLWRFVPLALLTGIGALCLTGAVLGLLNRALRGGKSFPALFVFPLMVFHANAVHQLAINVLSIRDFFRSFDAWVTHNWRWVSRLNEEIASGSRRITVTSAPGRVEESYNFELLEAHLWDKPNVDYVSGWETDLAKMDYLTGEANFNHAQDVAYIPHVWKGYRVKKTPVTPPQPVQKKMIALTLKSGDRIQFHLMPDSDLTVLGVQLTGDTHAWHDALNLQIRLMHDGQTIAEQIIAGSQTPRMRSSPPVAWFNEPLPLKGRQLYSIEVVALSDKPRPLGYIFLAGIETAGGVKPMTTLMTGEPLPESFEIFFEDTVQRSSFITASPWGMFLRFRNVGLRGWHHDFWRTIQYTYHTELYRNRARLH